MSIASSHYDRLADDVVSMYFDHGTDLSEGVAKVAQREALNPEEIHRVVERANQSAFSELRKEGGEDHTFEFPLADMGRINGILHPVKIASAPSRYVSKSVVNEVPKIPERNLPVAWEALPHQKLAYVTELYEQAKEAEYERDLSWEEDSREAIAHFCKTARLTCHYEDLTPEEVYVALRDARPKLASMTADLMDLTARTMGRKFNKLASPAPDELFDRNISQGDGTPARCVNGDHTLVLCLDTLSELENRRAVTDTKDAYLECVTNLTGRRIEYP